MSTIATNIASLKTLYNLQKNEGGYTEAVERLSSGMRINKAGDDAAGAAIVNRMTSQIAGMNVAIRNAGDAISMAQVAEGALNEVSEILQRMRELAVQGANGTYNGADRISLNEEVVQLKNELIRISETTTFNNTKLLNGAFQDTIFEIGFDESPKHTHMLTIDDIRPNKIGVWNISTQLEKTESVSSVAAASGGASGTITMSSDHGFENDDVVTYEKGTGAILGLEDGKSYVVKDKTDTTFTLRHLDGTTLTYGATTNNNGTAAGTGANFHLASLAGAPSAGMVGTDPVGSDVSKTENLKIYGYVGDETVVFKSSATAQDIAEAVNSVTDSTGVMATASTHARITLDPNDLTENFTVISFDIKGMNENSVNITSTVKFGTADGETSPDLSDLRDKINGFSGDTGITAELSSDRTYIDLTSADGYDIVIDDFDLPLSTSSSRSTATVADGTNMSAAGVITTNAAHGFTVGDVITMSSIAAGEVALGGTIALDTKYVVTSVGTTTSANDNFTLALASDGLTGTQITTGGPTLAGGGVTFTKMIKGMQIQTLDRDGNTKGTNVTLNDKNLTGEKIATSTRITGEVVYTSPNVFTIVPQDDDSLFRDDPSSASLQKISDMDILTVRKAQRMLSSVDGALRRIDAERGDLGATMNRMQHTIDNLSNIVVNTELSRSRIRDADMAEESVQLSKYQVLQQAANAMLAQANQSMSSVLDLLR